MCNTRTEKKKAYERLVIKPVCIAIEPCIMSGSAMEKITPVNVVDVETYIDDDEGFKVSFE